jgi:hypothetical protein
VGKKRQNQQEISLPEAKLKRKKLEDGDITNPPESLDDLLDCHSSASVKSEDDKPLKPNPTHM